MSKANIEDMFERVTMLERRERNHADEILSLHRENNDLRKRVESTERKYEKLKGKMNALKSKASVGDTEEKRRKTVDQLKGRCDAFESSVMNLEEQVKEFAKIQSTVQNLDRMTKVLNRAMIEAHQTPLPADRNATNPRLIDDLGKQVAGLLKWKAEKAAHDQQMLERIRSIAKQTGSMDAIEDQLSMLMSWKEKKEVEDEKMTKRLDDNMKKINSNFTVLKDNMNKDTPEASAPTAMPKKLQDQLVKTVDSIFCADLAAHQSLGGQLDRVKINRCTAAFQSNTGPFDSQTGTFMAQHDGAYNLGWKIHQRGDGKIRYVMAIDGMQGRTYLGHTDEAGDICSGSLVVPLKKGQRVWIEAKRVAGTDAKVYRCNFMGWLIMELNTLGSLEEIANLQQKLFSSILAECQHL